MENLRRCPCRVKEHPLAPPFLIKSAGVKIGSPSNDRYQRLRSAVGRELEAHALVYTVRAILYVDSVRHASAGCVPRRNNIVFVAAHFTRQWNEQPNTTSSRTSSN